ncbi:MAG: hypothetical protein KatS3mg130_0644 [Candidatus Sumerlaea sp.]|nr:MAG: hypothetical protein KatS3mg130_0644 [Candidatus Sumerlaea sp.]
MCAYWTREGPNNTDGNYAGGRYVAQLCHCCSVIPPCSCCIQKVNSYQYFS